MRESTLQNPAPPETSGQPLEAAVTPEVISQKRAKVVTALERVRLLPEDWKSAKSGESRSQIIEKLENALLQLDEYEVPAPVEAPVTVTPQVENELHPNLKKKAVTSTVATEARRRLDEAGHYITFGSVHIPICQTPQEHNQWQAVPGEIFVSGGERFSKVRFLKDSGGLTYAARPGELMNFSEKHRGKRLNPVDTVLEGRNEWKAFNETLLRLGEMTRQYEELNPDDADYDEKAKELAATIEKFISPKGLKEIFKLDGYGIVDVDDFVERTADIIRTQQFLRSLDENMNEFIPPHMPHFKLSPFFEGKFKWFATLVNRQLGLGNNAYLEKLVKAKEAPEWERLSAKGMTVLVGPRGAGKNELVNFYCSETNRPLFRYACSSGTEERDLTYDVEISDQGIVKVPTRILNAITTPNAVLELDEVNVLTPSVSKFFNSLLDGDRAVFLKDQVIKTAPGVIIIGLMNPSDYEGVSNLPETIDDRSNIMTMGYPPFRETNPLTGNERFTHDEALILKENIAPLKNLSDEDFRKIWDYVVNGIATRISLDAATPKIIKDLKNIITIANRTRETVEAYKTRTGDTRMERDISLRGTIDATRFYSENHLWEAELSNLPDWQAGWNAAQYAVAMTYFPHTDTYKRGKNDLEAMKLILAEAVA